LSSAKDFAAASQNSLRLFRGLLELQQQMTALQEHVKTREGISDEKQLLSEMKKHQ
jgi:hypothetical protein